MPGHTPPKVIVSDATFPWWISPCKNWKGTHAFLLRHTRIKPSVSPFSHCFLIRSFFWSVFSCIQSEYRKIRSRKISVFRHFSRSVQFLDLYRKISEKTMKRFQGKLVTGTQTGRRTDGQTWICSTFPSGDPISHCGGWQRSTPWLT